MFKRGDRICIGVALASYYGYVSQTYNMAGRLPKEFQQAFQPVTGHVSSGWELEPDQRDLPPLFAKTQLSAAGRPSDWLRRPVLSHLPFPTMAPEAGAERS